MKKDMNDKDIINIQNQLVELTESLEVIETLRDDIAHFRAHEEEEYSSPASKMQLCKSPLRYAEGSLHTAYEELDNAIKALEKTIDYWGEEE